MNMLLGIFESKSFITYNKKPGVNSFPFYRLLGSGYTGDLHQMILEGIQKADICYFSLDDIYTPLNSSASVTCQELEFILKNESLLSKVVFVKDEKELLLEEALKYLNHE